MGESRRVLILGGTGEAVALAERLAHDPRFAVTTSLAGVTQSPRRPEGSLRIGGFGGPEGLAAYLRDQAIDAVIDVTHPFAARISAHAVEACAATGTALLRLRRPPWTPEPGDRWIEVRDVTAAAERLPERGARAFLSVGRQELAAFASCRDTWFLVRLIEPPEGGLPLANATLLQARGPFRTADEVALLTAHAIAVVVTKNSGGAATYGKIAAARHLGLPVLMIARPALAPAEEVASPEELLRRLG